MTDDPERRHKEVLVARRDRRASWRDVIGLPPPQHYRPSTVVTEARRRLHLEARPGRAEPVPELRDLRSRQHPAAGQDANRRPCPWFHGPHRTGPQPHPEAHLGDVLPGDHGFWARPVAVADALPIHLGPREGGSTSPDTQISRYATPKRLKAARRSGPSMTGRAIRIMRTLPRSSPPSAAWAMSRTGAAAVPTTLDAAGSTRRNPRGPPPRLPFGGPKG